MATALAFGLAACLAWGCAPQPERLVDEAIEKIQARAYNAQAVDWQRERERARAILAEGGSTHAAVASLLAALKDGHSFHIGAVQRKEALDNPRIGDFGIESRLVEGHGYVAVPTYAGNDRARMRGFVAEIDGRIKALASSGACGWIVDLRGNGGGNMYPMILGLASMLGPGRLGSFSGRSEQKEWSIETVAEPILAASEIPPPALAAQPVAVLVGPMTASSGEAVAISFIGRPSTRLFGQPTRGKSSGNVGVLLSDGSMMLVMSGLMADRKGVVYGGPIPPDEVVGPYTAEGSAPIAAAVRWLEKSGCAPQVPQNQIK